MSQPPQEITVKGKARRIRGATWTNDQIKKLFDVWSQPDIYQGLLNEKKKLDIFKNMASTLVSLGVNRTWRECRAKIKNLKADFRKAMEKKTPFRYYEQMKTIMNLDGSATGARRVSGASTLTIDSYFVPSGASTPHSSQSQHREDPDDSDDHDGEVGHPRSSQINPPLEPGTSDFEHATPSSSRSIIQRVPQIQKQESSYSHSRGHSPGLEGNDSNSCDPMTPPSSASSKYPTWSATDHQQSQDTQHAWRKQSRGTEEYFYSEKEQLRHQESHVESIAEHEHDSSSRSSMIITHVVSNVIEPVTQIVMPSSSGTGSKSVSEEFESTLRQPIIDDYDDSHGTTPPPIRLEFVLDNENLILQPPRSPTPDIIPAVVSQTHTTQPETITLPASPVPITSPNNASTCKSPEVPLSSILRQHLKKRNPPAAATATKRTVSSSASTKSSPREKKTLTTSSAARSTVESKRRKLVETLNRKTVETISDLLTETSQNLLQELQDAEQRFLLWEEEKRNEERKREEAMFTKLISAMKSSPFNTGHLHRAAQQETEHVEVEDDSESRLTSSFSNVSRRINDMVCGEVKQTEESLRQWEMKMQRQEGRHTERLFGMIINAIKTSSSSSCD